MNRTVLFLGFFLFVILSLPQTISDQIRSQAICCFLPFWKLYGSSIQKESFLELKNLQLENFQLRKQLDLVYEWLKSEKRLKNQIDLFHQFEKKMTGAPAFVEKRTDEKKALLQAQTMSVFARVLYRDPSSWSSSCWMDVGEENNRSLGKTIIAKNSPVVVGDSLVGIVEYVGSTQSRVRLITDSGFKTAVRAVRGSILDREIAMALLNLSELISKHPQLKSDPSLDTIFNLKSKTPFRWEDQFFAKGEIFGSSAPLYRSLKPTLKGVGFNYDFSDQEGNAMDLRSNLIQIGDILVTSGFDGVFPAGLNVAIVSTVFPLNTGDFSYEIEAQPMVQDLSDLKSAFILSPLCVD